MTQAEDIAARRAALRARYGASYERLSAILFEEDPIGINFGNNSDEYEPEVDTILPRLSECQTVVEIRQVVHAELVRWFDGVDVGSPERYSRIAQRVLDELPEVTGARPDRTP